jgi:dienelactone hydrolase
MVESKIADMKPILLFILLIASSNCVAARPVSRQDVQTGAFRGRLYLPVPQTHSLAIVLVGGSEGQLDLADEVAPQLAAAGYAVLGVNYHDGYRPGRKLDLVPIETFTAAVHWLYRSPIKPLRVAVLGDSRGSEGAFLTGIFDPSVSAVLAFVPSSVLWGATDNDAQHHNAAWSWKGSPLDCANCKEDGSFSTWLDKLRDDAPARLQVERIHGAIFLAGSSEDAVWPSARMSQEIAGRLLRNHFAYMVTLLTYPHSSHNLLGTGPSSPTASYQYGGKTYTMNYGGTAAGTEQARNESWAAMLLFLSQVEAAN